MSPERTRSAPLTPRPPVYRQRVWRALSELDVRDVAVVRARAGAGKTVALQRWSEYLDSVRHVEFGREADDPGQLMLDLGAAFAIDPAQLPLTDPPGPPAVVVRRLLDIAPTLPSHLIIDSVERLRSPWVLEAIDTLVASASPRMRIVLSGRSVPRLTSLAVMRVRDDVVDIGDSVFTLDEDEARELFILTVGREADPEVLRALLDYSEGWVAGFRLAAKEWREPSERTTEERLRAASGPIRDYLFGDVVGRLPPQLVQFLVDTCVLENLSAPMCDALRGTSDSARLLRELERATSFIEPIHRSRGRLRYHERLRDSLEDELATTDPARHQHLHTRAAQWCRADGDEVGAMRHLAAGGDLDRAWATFHEHWIERYYSGGFGTIWGWAIILGTTSSLSVDRASELAVAFIMLGQVDQAESFVIEAGRLQDASARPNAMLELARYLHAFARGSFDVAMMHQQTMREAAGSDHPPVWRQLRGSLGLSFLLSFVDRIDRAQHELECAANEEDTASPVDAVAFPTAAAHLALSRGRLSEADGLTDRALRAGADLSRPTRPLLSAAWATKGFIHLEHNELDAAEAYLTQALEHADAASFVHMRVLPRLGLARLRHAQGQRERAFALLAECRELPNTRLDHHFIERIAEIEAHLRLCDGDPQGALVTLPPLHGGRVTLIEVRALAALGEHEAALELLARTDPPGARRAIQAALVQARCLPDEEQRQKALTVAVQLSEQQGYVRILVDERAWLFERLMGLVPTWPTDYVARVIDASAHELAANEPHAPFAPSAQLSGRELEVWRYLATPLSLGEISRRLYISRNTMKTHVRNIYRKLGVATREAAVGVRVTERALPPPEL